MASKYCCTCSFKLAKIALKLLDMHTSHSFDISITHFSMLPHTFEFKKVEISVELEVELELGARARALGSGLVGV